MKKKKIPKQIFKKEVVREMTNLIIRESKVKVKK